MKSNINASLLSGVIFFSCTCGNALLAAAAVPPSAQVSEKIDVSRYELIGGTKTTISRGKVRITVTPLEIEPRKKMAVVFTDIGKGLNAGAGQSCLYKQQIPYYIRQLNISFNIKIENDMEQPLRTTKNGEGAIFSLQIGTKAVSVGHYPKDEHVRNLEDWGGLIILPGSSMEMVYEGPFLDYISSSTTITLAIYDLATETNEDGDGGGLRLPSFRRSGFPTFKAYSSVSTPAKT